MKKVMSLLPLVGCVSSMPAGQGTVAIPQPLVLKYAMPEKWDTLKMAVSSKIAAGVGHASLSGYFMAYLYNSPTCSNEKSMVMATGTGVCFVGFQNETAVGSIVYELGDVGDGYFTIHSSLFEDNFDCSGPPVSHTFNLPTSCHSEETSNYVYAYTTNPTVWATYEPGFMAQSYDTSDNCIEGGISGSFFWYKLNNCILITNSDGSNGGTAFTACGDGLYTQTVFSDSTCSEFDMSITSKLKTCEAEDGDDQDGDDDDDDDGFDTSNYSTYMCSSA